MAIDELMDDDFFDVETIDIPLEDGTTMTCAILDEFEFNGRNYMMMSEILPDDSIGEDVFCYRFTEEENEDGETDVILEYIEDDEELAAVDEAYAQMLEEEDEYEEDQTEE